MMTDHLSRWEWKKSVDLESLYIVAHFLIQLFLTSETKSCAQTNSYEFLYFLKKCVQYFNNQLASNSAINKSEIKNSDSGHKKCICIYKFLIKSDFVHLNCPIKMSDTQPTEKKEENKADRRSVSRSGRLQAIEVPQPLWQRRDSFSSCSSDSAVYCSSQHGQVNNYEGVKRPLPGRRSDRLAKRHRHSSGSSASSNVSCLSEKDPKNLSEHPPTPLLNNAQKDVEDTASPLPQAKSSPVKVQTVIEERISYACKSEAGSPYRHNLRRNIKKKACCNCDCGSSRTTVVVRRFTQIRHEAVEESRDLATHKTPPSPQLGEPVNNTFIHTKEASCDSETFAGNKKRRREVDKLYDALHEIKWASHFSPDNILNQIDIRRAASCSMFSPVKSNVNTSILKDKALFPKKECLSSRKANLQRNNIHNLKKDITELNHTNHIKFNTDPLNNKYGRVTRQQNYAARETSLEAGKLSKIQISAIKQKQLLRPKKGFSDELLRCNNKRDFHISMQPVNKKEESFFQTNKNKLSPKIYNTFINSTHPTNNVPSEHKLPESTDCLSEQNESNCLETVWNDKISTKSNCLAHTKTNLSSLFNNSKSTADMNQHQLITTVTEKSELNSDDSGFNMNKHLMRATFLDISGEAIQAIDACFQEIVGEVEVTTSEMVSELPRLTSVNEVSPVIKRRRNEKPPLLELCTSTLPEGNILETDSEFAIANLQNCDSETVIMSSVCNMETAKSKLEEKASASSLSYSQIYSYKKCPSLNQIARKRILKKYRKYSLSKSGPQCKQSECISSTCVDESVSALRNCDLFNSSNTRDNSFAVDEDDSEVDSLTSSMSNEKYRSFSSKSVSPQFEEFNVRSHLSDFSASKHSDYEPALAQPCQYQDMESENITNHTFFKSSQMTYHSDAGAHTSYRVDSSRNIYEPSPKVNHTKSSFSIKFNNYSIPQALPKIVDRETENKKSHDDVVRHSIRFGFTFHYKAITVNRNDSYTQILLRITRGKRIFLTHEALLELKDAVNGARNDTRCQVLIINGSGDSFCSGLDLRSLIGPHKSKAAKSIAVAVKEFIEALADFHKPLVAVVNGAACGLGVTILNHADVSIASDEATFCMPYPFLGYTPEGGATLTLPQAVGATMASDMMLRGRVLTAREACDAGLICEVLPAKRLPYELVDRVRVLVDTPSTPLQTTKQLVRMRLLQDLRYVLEDEVKLLPRMWLSSDCQGALHKALDSGLLDH